MFVNVLVLTTSICLLMLFVNVVCLFSNVCLFTNVVCLLMFVC